MTAAREPMIRVIAMPADTNPSGDIFGGWLMAQMDLAAGNLAMRLAEGRCVTVAVDAMAFLSPVHVGDEVILDAMLAHPILVNRPIVVTPKGTKLCRPSETVLDLLDRMPEGFAKEDGAAVLGAGRRV